MSLTSLLQQEFDWYIAISRGGLQPAMLLAKFTDQRAIDTLPMKSYDHAQQTKQDLTVYPKDFSHLRDQRVLLVDDLADTGETLEKGREYLQQFQPADLKTFVVYWKNHSRTAPDYYLTSWPSDQWIYFDYDDLTWEQFMTYSLTDASLEVLRKFRG
jgi:hypoxanthine phosphoribosyltransferase